MNLKRYMVISALTVSSLVLAGCDLDYDSTDTRSLSSASYGPPPEPAGASSASYGPPPPAPISASSAQYGPPPAPPQESASSASYGPPPAN